MTSNFDQKLNDLYREESGRMIAVLTRIFGTHNLEMAEDVVQEAFSKAFTHWQANEWPDNPAAWLMTTAKNQAIDIIRRERRLSEFSKDLNFRLSSEWSLAVTIDEEFQEGKIKDDQLRMIFMCCSSEITPDNRLPIILRTLCGFNNPAIAKALLIGESTINKRLMRTRKKMAGLTFEFPNTDRMPHSMDTVHTSIYLLFNEGYHSSSDQTVQREFCQEAMRLVALLLVDHIANADTYALSALMKFHFSRISSREDENLEPIGLDEQDRNLWDRELIGEGFQELAKSQTVSPGSSGRVIYEAGIASLHCSARNFQETDWASITHLYSKLVDLTGSPIAKLNQSVAVGYQHGPESAIPAVTKLCEEHHSHPSSNSFWAVLAHLYARAGMKTEAWENAEKALSLAKTKHERSLIRHQIENLVGLKN
ncbi:MAG: RNA polymerase sigma factor (sigma-70 family) [Nitrospinales bacterium]